MFTEKNVARLTSTDILVYIHGLMRESLEKRPFPDKIWGGVNGFKGGCGNTYITKNLSTVALALGFSVIHVPAHRDCNNSWGQEFYGYDFSNSNLRICRDVEHAIEESKSFPVDFVFVDLPRDAFCNVLGYQKFENLLRSRLHLLISPVTAETPINNIRALHSLGSSDPLPLYRRMLVPLNKSFNSVSMRAAIDNFAKFPYNVSDMFLTELDPLEYDLNDPIVPVRFKDSDSEDRYASLLTLSIKMAISRSMEELRELRQID